MRNKVRACSKQPDPQRETRPGEKNGQKAPERAQTSAPEFQKAKSVHKSQPEAMKSENKTTKRAQTSQGNATTVKTIIVLGDSTVKQFKIDGNNTKTYCFPNAMICDITENISSILSDHKSVNKIIILEQMISGIVSQCHWYETLTNCCSRI